MAKIIAEIGINHGGDFNTVKTLIEQASLAGCWGVKLQYRDLKSFYHRTDEVSDLMIYEEIKRNDLSINELKILSDYAREVHVKFGLSFFRLDDFNSIEEHLDSIDFFKVPSAECLNIPLIQALIEKKKLVFVSTGGHLTHEIISTLNEVKSDIIILHCVANYPVRLGDQDLNIIDTFKKVGFQGIGYSSHDIDWEVCLLAIAKGADWIERHITLDKNNNGLDHTSSSIYHDFKRLATLGSHYQEIAGGAERGPNQGEMINLQNVGTSLYANANLEAGKVPSLEDFSIRAPRLGLSVGAFVKRFQNKPLIEGLRAGEPLTETKFLRAQTQIQKSTKNFCRRVRLGLPVRLHDYDFIKSKFDPSIYEFHLSFSEVLSEKLPSMLKKIQPDEHISIHLPDYIPGNNLVDPISPNNEIRLKSIEIIDRVCDWADSIEQIIQKKVNIVGSFSCTHQAKRENNLENIFDYINSKESSILPQWLPVFAWYFGGSVKLNLFNSQKDIDFLKKNNLKICLDFSHLVMAAEYYSCDWKVWYKELVGLTEHIHLADAEGVASEGLMIGEGAIGDFSEILSIDKNKILECWQGHINGGQGFERSLQILKKQYSEGSNISGF